MRKNMPRILLLSAMPYDMPDEFDPSKPHNVGLSIRFISDTKDPKVNGNVPMRASLPMEFAEQLMKAVLPAACDVELDLKGAAGGKAGVTFSAVTVLRSVSFTQLMNSLVPPANK
ncbi:MAG: hypothetical protein Q8L02_03015 [Candidatus Nitrotoga sp.]|nr:hypothetical protein [Candidatus Nitrotoga sp.]